MVQINVITQSVQKELEAFNALYKKALDSHIPDFQYMLDFVSGKKGKRIRPLIVLLSAKLCGEITQKTLEYAVILELLHIATLIHDDVVDHTIERRGQPSVMAQFDNRAAVLLGDYILSQAIVRSVETENLTILKIMSGLAQNIVEGELTQLVSSSGIIVDEMRYFDIIWKKTAVLLASCMQMGALSVNAEPEKVEILRLIGENLGICFQIKDDLFDYFEQGNIGKPTGNDIREGKITLPLIYAFNHAPKEKADSLLSIIQKQSFSSENIQLLTDFAKEYKGIEYAEAKMEEIKTKTLHLFDKFPNSETRTALIQLMNYIIEREK
ncbi:octaprenyl-diphosphate synthase [Bacteroidia bacterium]|nr:octaprenyl-diphosphate synthase [Bacteroidia bacterium]